MEKKNEIMNKLNCWEFKECSSDCGCDQSDPETACPVADDLSANGLNGGVNGGRICWAIIDKPMCLQCEFRYKVMADEGFLNTCHAIGKYLKTG